MIPTTDIPKTIANFSVLKKIYLIITVIKIVINFILYVCGLLISSIPKFNTSQPSYANKPA